MGIILRLTSETANCVPNDNDFPGKILVSNQVGPHQGDRRLEVTDERIPASQRVLARSICGIVKKEYLNPEGGLLKPNTTTRLNLGLTRRKWAQQDVETKKAALRNFFIDLLGQNPASGSIEEVYRTVEGLPWPNFFAEKAIGFEEDVKIKFAEQTPYSNGTGWRIGSRYIVTAGHVVDAMLDNWEDYRAVFNMTENASDHRVYSFRKIVHFANPQHSFKQNPMKWIPDLNDPSILPTTSDIAVLELDANPAALNVECPPLHIAPRPMPVGSRVFLIGSPEGLPLKFVDAGKIRRAVDEADTNDAISAKDQSSLSVEIDLYGGNSGSPLFETTSAHNFVVGCAQGSNWEAATIGYASGQGENQSQLGKAINAELKMRLGRANAIQTVAAVQDADTARYEALNAARFGTTNNFKSVDPGYCDFFWELALYPHPGSYNRSGSHLWGNSHVTSGAPGLKINVFSRVDLIHHLNTRLDHFTAVQPAIHLDLPQNSGGHVELDVNIHMIPAPAHPVVVNPLASELQLSIVTENLNGEVVHVCDRVFGAAPGPAFVAGDILVWSLNSANQIPPLNANAVAMQAGGLNGTLMTDLVGIHGWKKIVVKKMAGAIIPGEAAPQVARIFVKLVPKPSAPAGTYPRNFDFQAHPVFSRNPVDATEWVAHLGKFPGTSNLDAVWKGPL